MQGGRRSGLLDAAADFQVNNKRRSFGKRRVNFRGYISAQTILAFDLARGPLFRLLLNNADKIGTGIHGDCIGQPPSANRTCLSPR